MTEILLTISQALQLVALAPCIFVVAFLLCSARRNGDNVVPILYFLALGSSFIIPLLPIFGPMAEKQGVKACFLLTESTTVALSYLLVIQFLKGRIPSPMHWLILFIPLIGGSPFIYANMFASEVCLDAKYCFTTDNLRMLYAIFSSALIFLLLIVQLARSTSRIAIDDVDRTHKYWLIIALVSLNLILLGIDLAQLAAQIENQDALFIATAIRIAFIYLALTSIFRVFYDLFDIEILSPANNKLARNPEHDKSLVERIKNMLEQEHVYREMGLSRESLSKQIGSSEHQTSRIINTYFDKNFNELINDYRIKEAKERLLTEDTQITTIAFEVGFNSIASFNRVFKEITGVSPTEFRSFHKASPK